MQRAFLVYPYYADREKPFCCVVVNSLEDAYRQVGGEPLDFFEGEYRVHIPFEICKDTGQPGILGRKNRLVYTNGPITLEIDPNHFTGGVLALREIPLFGESRSHTIAA